MLGCRDQLKAAIVIQIGDRVAPLAAVVLLQSGEGLEKRLDLRVDLRGSGRRRGDGDGIGLGLGSRLGGLLSLLGGSGLLRGLRASPPQAARERSIARASSRQIIAFFFMVFPP